MPRLNYHHLYYFWRVARAGNLTRAAEAMHVSQSALSTQIRQLEESFDTPLFTRSGRRLVLTEAGQRVLALATDIFTRGEELESLLRRGIGGERQHLHIGMVSTMSRNFVDALMTPLLDDTGISFVLRAGSVGGLLDDLADHRLDVVLANINVTAGSDRPWQIQLLARQPVTIVGPTGGKPRTRFPRGYEKQRWLLPGPRSEMRAAFDGFCALHHFEPDIQAEVDDMAMLRLLARDSGSLAVLPEVVVRDEIEARALVEYLTIPGAYESFYAITVKRSFQPPALANLLAAAGLSGEPGVAGGEAPREG